MAALLLPPSADAAAAKEFDETLGRYAIVNSGWSVNMRCNLLDRAARREFEWSLSNIDADVARRYAPRVLRSVRQGAEDEAEDAKYAACGDLPQTIVERTAAMARDWSRKATGVAYDPASSYREYTAARFIDIALGMNLDLRCHHIPAKARDTLIQAYRHTRTGLADMMGLGVVSKLEEAAAARAGAEQYRVCGADTQRTALEAGLDLRRLFLSLEQERQLAN